MKYNKLARDLYNEFGGNFDNIQNPLLQRAIEYVVKRAVKLGRKRTKKKAVSQLEFYRARLINVYGESANLDYHQETLEIIKDLE